jgi:hypothetical protein
MACSAARALSQSKSRRPAPRAHRVAMLRAQRRREAAEQLQRLEVGFGQQGVQLVQLGVAHKMTGISPVADSACSLSSTS